MTSTTVPDPSAEPTALTPDAWGLLPDWVDAQGQQQRVADNMLATFRSAIGDPPADLAGRRPVVTRPGNDLPPELHPQQGRVAEVRCEDGSVQHLESGTLAADFPLGYHRVRPVQGTERRLIVSPGRCCLPSAGRAWGWTVQLYALRSQTSWGMGDLGDLRAVREWAQGLGAGFLLINPLHAVAPTHPQETSPYLPATRRFLNPIYICVGQAPGADDVDITPFEEQADALPSDDVSRDAVWSVKRAALRTISDAVDECPIAAQWRAEQGTALQEFAIWCVLADQMGADWRTWPEPLRRPHSDAVAAFGAEHADEVAFYAWLQWVLDLQLRAATGEMTVIQDLPIGVGGSGADAWAWQDQLADDVYVGAPPDAFNAAGQDWGSPPLVPWRLQAAEYEPFIQSLRATMAGAGGIRIDHVMGLFRLWWVPAGGSPADGAYVRYPSAEMLDIVALESHRAGALVVGEDLGTVEPGVRETLADHDVLSYKVLWFEDADPVSWQPSSMAAVSTHDLPTVAGLWSGSDVAEQAELGLGTVDELAAGRAEILGRLVQPAGLQDSASDADAVLAAHRLLARAPSVLLAATLEDAVTERRRPNVPGTTERANWRLPLPVAVEDLPAHEGAQAVARVLGGSVREVPPGDHLARCRNAAQ